MLAKDYEVAALEIVPADGSGFIALRLAVVEDGVAISSTNHRVAILVDTPTAEVLAMTDAQLTAQGYPALDPADAACLSATLDAARSSPGKALLARPAPPAPPPAALADPAGEDGR